MWSARDIPRLDDTTALVTGATAGIGLETVVATTTADLRGALAASPAEQVWQLVDRSGRHRLIDLPYTDTRHGNEFPTHTTPDQEDRAA